MKAAPIPTVLAKTAREDSASIGNAMLRLGYITEADLLLVKNKQSYIEEALLVALLVNSGVIGAKEVAVATGIQQMMRDGNDAIAELSIIKERINTGAKLGALTGQAIETLRGRKKKLTPVTALS